MASYSSSNKYFSGIIPHPELDSWELSVYQKIFPKTIDSLVDLGCGTGEFLALAKSTFKNILGVDINDYAIKTCKSKKIPVVKTDVLNTKLPANSFGVVRAKELIEHLQSPEKLILEAKRILKKNGYLVVHVPTQWSTFYPITNFWDDYTHVRAFSKRGITRLLTDFGFEIVFCKGYTVGRNTLETMLGKIIEKIFPFCWFVIAQKSHN